MITVESDHKEDKEVIYLNIVDFWNLVPEYSNFDDLHEQTNFADIDAHFVAQKIPKRSGGSVTPPFPFGFSSSVADESDAYYGILTGTWPIW